MQPSYPLTGPPTASGIYLIKNKTTGCLYVGQSVDLRRRYVEWRTVFSSGLGATNPALHEAIKNSNIEDWAFIVFELCPPTELNVMEKTIISKLQDTIGTKCLNGHDQKLPGAVTTARVASVQLSTVLNEEGVPMTHAQIAERCGVNRESVKKRLSKWRRKGKTNLTITDLL